MYIWFHKGTKINQQDLFLGLCRGARPVLSHYQMRLVCLLATLLVGIALSAPHEAVAATRSDKAVFGYTVAHYKMVGNLSKRLSYACQRREFSQKRQYRYIIGFIGPKGRAITGIATTRWNLYDPKRLATEGMTYHFYNDGYSDCAVYTSPQPLQ